MKTIDASTYEPMYGVGFEMKFREEPTDEEIQLQTVHQWMREWIDYSNGAGREMDVDDIPIEDVMMIDDFSAYVRDEKTGQTGKMYSSGMKHNGKIDIGFIFSDGRQTIMRDCEMKPDLSDTLSEMNITMEYEHPEHDDFTQERV